MYYLMDWTDYEDVFRGLVLLDEDNWHMWRERRALSMTVSGRVKTEDDSDWSDLQDIRAFQLESEEGKRFATPPTKTVDELQFEDDVEEVPAAVDLRRRYDGLPRAAVDCFERQLMNNGATRDLLVALAKVEGLIPNDLFVSSWQAVMFHRHAAVVGVDSPVDDLTVLEIVAGMGSKKRMQQHCGSLESQGAVALLKLIDCWRRGKGEPAWAIETLLEEDLLATWALDEMKGRFADD